MRPQKILLFFAVIIACLAFLASVFPPTGIVLFKKTFYFPALTKILTRTPEAATKDPEEILKLWKIESLRQAEDSIKTSVIKLDTTDAAKNLETTFEKIFALPNGELSYFDSFFSRAETARAQHKIVRVLYYGDSQIEMDRFSNNLRLFLQEKFGGGGPGMAPYEQSIPSEALNQSFSGEYSCYSLWGETRRNRENDYGPLAKMFRIEGNNRFSASTFRRKTERDRRDNFSNIALLINNLKGSFNAELTDRTHQTEYTLQTDSTGIQLLDFPLNFSTKSFSINMKGNANIYGILIDDGFGIAVDNIAMRSASGLHFTSMNDSLIRETYRLLNVGMFILQYGGNVVPGLYSEKSVENYVANIIAQIKYLQRVAPGVPILFIGPADMLSVVEGELRTYKQLPYLVEKMRVEIPQSGAAFWNMYEVMGGANSMRAWVRKGWAGHDYVHFTGKGAYEIANVLTQTFEIMYEHYKTK
jgi:hypothetical protein